jgi:hypothetical protein
MSQYSFQFAYSFTRQAGGVVSLMDEKFRSGWPMGICGLGLLAWPKWVSSARVQWDGYRYIMFEIQLELSFSFFFFLFFFFGFSIPYGERGNKFS